MGDKFPGADANDVMLKLDARRGAAESRVELGISLEIVRICETVMVFPSLSLEQQHWRCMETYSRSVYTEIPE